MRSSKHSKKKGLFGGKTKGTTSRYTSEINDDFLKEFRELEKKQAEIEEEYQQSFFVRHTENSKKSHENTQETSRETSVNLNLGASKKPIDKNPIDENPSSDDLFQTKVFTKVDSQALGDSFERNAMKNSKDTYEDYNKSNIDRDFISEIDQEIEKPKKEKKKKEKKQKKNKKGGSTTGKKVRKVLLILLLLIAVCAVGIYYYIDVQLGKLDHVDTDISEFAIDTQVAKDLKGYRNVAVLGVDARAGEDQANTRTDAIIVASLDKKTGDVALISVMRDTYLEMDSQTGDIMYDKATHAHVFGGPVNTCKMLNKSLDLNISEFVVMDWKSVSDTVDALGGITVDVQQNEIWDLNHWGPETAENTGKTWTPIYNTGKQKIDGVQAATYCRIRKNSGGDTGRTERMRKVVMSILREVKQNPTKITTVADKVLPEVKTNMSTFDITTLLPQVINFEIKDSVGYPYNYYGGSVNGSWKAVPTTLSENTIRLHKEAFKQTEYVPSARLEQISQNIINNTGISQGYEQ